MNPYVTYLDTIEEVLEELVRVTEQRTELDFLIDGAVVKVVDMRTREALGYTDKFPRWAVAFKFEAEETTTVLESVSWEVGRTGKITPVARVEAVDLAGVTVQNCTLNNIGDIERKNLKYALVRMLRFAAQMMSFRKFWAKLMRSRERKSFFLSMPFLRYGA